MLILADKKATAVECGRVRRKKTEVVDQAGRADGGLRWGYALQQSQGRRMHRMSSKKTTSVGAKHGIPSIDIWQDAALVKTVADGLGLGLWGKTAMTVAGRHEEL